MLISLDWIANTKLKKYFYLIKNTIMLIVHNFFFYYYLRIFYCLGLLIIYYYYIKKILLYNNVNCFAELCFKMDFFYMKFNRSLQKPELDLSL